MPSPKNIPLVRCPDALVDAHGPPLHRGLEVSLLSESISSVQEGRPPLHCWIYGPSGSGKTTVLRHVLDRRLPESVTPIYLNCRHRFTFLDMVEQILEHEKVPTSPQRTRSSQVRLLHELLDNRPSVIALDAIDYLRQSDVNDLLAHLCTLPRASIICASNSRSSLLRLHGALKSRLAPRQIEFRRYHPDETRAILNRMARRALLPGSWSDQVLEHVAIHARGDARRAIALFRHLVQRCEGAGRQNLHSSMLRTGNFDHFNRRVEEDLEELSSHHGLLYELVTSKEPISGPELAQAYVSMIERRGGEPVATRTIHKYLTVLCLKRILRRSRGAGTSGWIYRLSRPPQLASAESQGSASTQQPSPA